MTSTNLIGYDLDGVICGESPKRKKPFFKQNAAERKAYAKKRLLHCRKAKLKIKPTGRFIIVTARKQIEQPATVMWLKNNGICPEAIYFLDKAKTRENIIKFKSDVINTNNLVKYYDDDKEICKQLIGLCQNTKIIHVNNEIQD
jgi:hypothetical protein